VVAGDTKVVPRGKGDGCYITTAGLGVVPDGVELGADRARPGDRVLITGPAGQHGAAIMASRSGIDLGGGVVSDCAPLSPLVLPLLERPQGLHAMRDPTRGGVGTTLCELAESSGVGIELDEARLPVSEPVRIACDLLGLDPLLLACEGQALIIATPEAADRALRILHSTPDGHQAVAIGEVQQGPPRVVLRTAIGGRRLITVPASDPLPRIC
jgi:hydrogenase expression/formation protein HypE